jgi:catalase (peroxidase I)
VVSLLTRLPTQSVSDLVALGTVMSMGLCGGQRVPYRPGRVDALQADPTTGVPAPETDLEETLVFFERAGFNQADSIGLTACGHTMGSVHHVCCLRQAYVSTGDTHEPSEHLSHIIMDDANMAPAV